ncbi:MAG: hypothetical protein NWS20_04675 [Rickettsiaceae bacterium]|nr:hypothetical protein [Rickettsiaceae bacterium]
MKMSVFNQNQETEHSLSMGLLLGLIFCMGDNAPLNLVQALCMGFVMSLCIHVIKILFYRGGYFLGIHQEEKFVFNGGIDSLISSFYKVGFKLKNKLGDYYIFTTNYRFLPNSEILVRNNKHSCYLSGRQILFKYLKTDINLEELSAQSNIGDNESAGTGHDNSQRGNASVHSPINEDRKRNKK